MNFPKITLVICFLALCTRGGVALTRVQRAPGAKGRRGLKSAASRYNERINRLHSKNEDSESGETPATPNFWKGLAQLVTMGAGAPSLGEFKEIDESGKAIFELEANNFLKETDGKFFERGYVEGSDDDIGAPGFFENLLSGGKAMREWEKKRAGL